MFNGDREALVQLTALNDQRWKAVRDYVAQWDNAELAEIHDMLMAKEEEHDEDGPIPNDEELLIAICAMVGMCKMVEELWRIEDKGENDGNVG